MTVMRVIPFTPLQTVELFIPVMACAAMANLLF